MLPAQTLASWRNAATALHTCTDPLERWRRWLDCLAARAHCSGGRLGGLLIDLELCTLADIDACVHAQLVAGRLDDDSVRFDVEDDVRVVQRRGTVEQLERLSLALERCAWAQELSPVDHVHVELADRWLALGQTDGIVEVLARVRWHLPLLDWLALRGDQLDRLDPCLRVTVAGLALGLVERSPLPLDYHVGLFAQLAIIGRDHLLLARAQALAHSLPPEQRAVTPDHPYLFEDIAWALVRLDREDEAEVLVASFALEDRWPAWLRLLPFAPTRRARKRWVDAMLELVEPLELRWAWVVEAAPETAGQALAAIERIADLDQRLDQLCSVARWLDPDRGRRACLDAITLRERTDHPLGSTAWIDAWEALLDALTDCGCEALLDLPARHALIQTLLANPAIELWREAARFIPDDLALAVLDRSSAGLAVADHCIDREEWIALGATVLDRVPPTAAAAWRIAAAAVVVGTPLDGGAAEKLASFSLDQQRQIVLARLAQHRQAFLPELVFGRWFAALRRTRGPIVVSPDPHERARCLAAFELLTRSDWPTTAERDLALALLGRGLGEDAWTEAIAELASLVRGR